jgi:hypothetical protein
MEERVIIPAARTLRLRSLLPSLLLLAVPQFNTPVAGDSISSHARQVAMNLVQRPVYVLPPRRPDYNYPNPLARICGYTTTRPQGVRSRGAVGGPAPERAAA